MTETLIWNELGTLHYNAGAYDQAIKAYHQAVELDHGFGLAVHNLAQAYAKKGLVEKALTYYQKSLDLLDSDQDKALSWKNLGDSYSQLGEFEKALTAYQKAYEMAPDEALFKTELSLRLNELFRSDGIPDEPEDHPDVLACESGVTGRAVVTADWGAGADEVGPLPVSMPDGGSASPSTGRDRDDNPDPVGILEGNPGIPDIPFDEEGAVLQQEAEPEIAGYFRQVFTEQIYPNPHQPRLYIDPTDLVDSVREYGIIQPLIVAATGDPEKYILISGERRLEAARQVGMRKVPVFVREADEQQLLELALIENVNRSNLTPMEQAKAFEKLAVEFGMPEEKLAPRIGKTRVAIANAVRLNGLPENLKLAFERGRITEGHAQALLALPSARLQVSILQQILKSDLSVRQTKALVNVCLAKSRRSSENRESDLEKGPIPPRPAGEFLSQDEGENQPSSRDETEPFEQVSLVSETGVPEEGAGEFAGAVVEPGAMTEPVEAKSSNGNPAIIQDFSDAPSKEASIYSPALERIRTSSITYKKVTELNPHNVNAWDMLGNLYLSLGEYGNAAHAFQQAACLEPEKELHHFRLGQAYILQQRYEEAVQKFLKVLELDSDNLYAHSALASCYRHLGLDEEARNHLAVIAPHMPYEKDYNRACFESICGNVDEAVQFLAGSLESGQSTLEQIRSDPDLDFIRGDKRFVELVERVACEV